MKKAYGIVTKGNGDAFATYERHTALSIGGGQAGQGYPCALIVKDERADGIFYRQVESIGNERDDAYSPHERGGRRG